MHQTGPVAQVPTKPRDSRSFFPATSLPGFWVVVSAAFLVRLGAMLVLHLNEVYFISARGAVAPDEIGVDRAARVLVQNDVEDVASLIGSVHTAWVHVSAFVYEHLWGSLVAIKAANVLLGTFAVLLTYLIGRRVGGPRTAGFAAWIAALFPTQIVWSALALREPVTLVCVLLILLSSLVLVSSFSIRAVARSDLSWMAVLVGSTLVLLLTRSYMVFVLAVVVGVAGVWASIKRGSLVPLVNLAVAGAIIVVVTGVVPEAKQAALNAVGLVASPAATPLNPLTPADDGQAPGQQPRTPEVTASVSTSVQSIRAKGVVRGVLIAVLAGRPVWETREWYFLLQPGVVAWWVLLPSFVLGGVVLLRRGLEVWILNAGFVLALMGLLAISGLFIRHHAMLEPAAFVTAGYAWDRWSDVPRRGRQATIIASAAMLIAALSSVAVSLTSG